LALSRGGGFVGVIGFPGDYGAGLDIRQLIAPMLRMQEIAVAPRSSFEPMNRAITQHGFRPVIEQTFPQEKKRDAFALGPRRPVR